MTRREWDHIKKNIEGGVYKLIRLAKLNLAGKYDIVIPFNKVTALGITERYNYIKSRVDQNGLEPGTYQVQCRLSPTNAAITDTYQIVVTERRPMNIGTNIEDKTQEQISDNDMNIDFDDHIKLIRENASLTALNALLETERDHYKSELSKLKSNGLGDAAVPIAKTTGEIIANTLTDIAPGLINLGDKFMSLMEKRLDNDTLRINSNQPKAPTKKIAPKPMAKTLEQEAQEEAEYLQELNESDPEKFEAELDALEQEDPELYDMVCDILGIEYDEEEGTQNEEQE
jgi:hypothetical protein